MRHITPAALASVFQRVLATEREGTEEGEVEEREEGGRERDNRERRENR